MTNPLEQIRELAEMWITQAKRAPALSPVGATRGECATQLLAILDASQGYVCVPVELAKDTVRLNWLVEQIRFVDLMDLLPTMSGDYIDARTAIDAAMLAASKETNRE